MTYFTAFWVPLVRSGLCRGVVHHKTARDAASGAQKAAYGGVDLPCGGVARRPLCYPVIRARFPIGAFLVRGSRAERTKAPSAFHLKTGYLKEPLDTGL